MIFKQFILISLHYTKESEFKLWFFFIVKMCDLLRPTVHKTVCDYAYRAGIDNPKLVVTEASKNGESYSGEVYRVVMTPNEPDVPDHSNNNNNNNNNGKL